MSASLKTTRVTTGGSAAEICASVWSSAIRPSMLSCGRVVVMGLCSQRVTAPVLVDEVLCGLLADGAEPLRAVRRHPDEIAGFDRVPGVAQPVDATAFEHQEAVLHDVNLHHAEGGAGIVGHGVHREVIGRAVGHERANA